jgi:hypothetical protein
LLESLSNCSNPCQIIDCSLVLAYGHAQLVMYFIPSIQLASFVLRVLMMVLLMVLDVEWLYQLFRNFGFADI